MGLGLAFRDHQDGSAKAGWVAFVGEIPISSKFGSENGSIFITFVDKSEERAFRGGFLFDCLASKDHEIRSETFFMACTVFTALDRESTRRSEDFDMVGEGCFDFWG